MTKCLLGTGNGEEVTRVGPKVDFREDFDPLGRDLDQVKRRRDWLTRSSSLAGLGPVWEKRACTEACGASFPATWYET